MVPLPKNELELEDRKIAIERIGEQLDLPALPPPPPRPAPVVKREVQVIDGVQISIFREDGKIIRLRSLGDHSIDAKITQQQDGRSYCTIAGHGTMPKTKNEATILSWFANACRALEITRILTSHNKEDAELLQELQPLLEAQKQIAAEKESAKTPRARKRDLQPATNLVYANFFVEDKTVFFAKAFDWLLEIPNEILKPVEKIILERLMKPKWGPEGFCKGIDEQTGIISGLKRLPLAKAVGLGRSALSENLIALQTPRSPDGEPWIVLRGREARLVWKEWCMPEKFRTCGNFAISKIPHLRKSGNKSSASAEKDSAPAEISPGLIESKKPHRERVIDYSSPAFADYSGPAPTDDAAKERQKSRDLKTEDETLGRIARISSKEKDENGGMWRDRIRICHKAVRNAVEDFEAKTPDQQRVIKNRGAWLTNQWQRALAEIHCARRGGPCAAKPAREEVLAFAKKAALDLVVSEVFWADCQAADWTRDDEPITEWEKALIDYCRRWRENERRRATGKW